jgi:hypothetical protein
MTQEGTFKEFVFHRHRLLTCCIIAFLILHFILLKIFYPHTIVIGDGHHYIRVANNNLEISGWPIGYPKFLAALHAIVRGDWIIAALQYMLLEGVIVYFYFTIRYLLRPGKWVSLLMLAGLLINPFVLFISNYVFSDGPFAALTVCWFTLTLWYLYKPRPVYAFLFVVVMVAAYSIRYYAMFYPLISFPVILFSKTRWWVKLSSISLACLLFLGFRWYTESLFEKSIGRREFSPLSGWRLAANALIMYRHLDHRETDTAPPELQTLHRTVLHYLAALPPQEILPDRRLMSYPNPLMGYIGVYFGDYVTTPQIQKWASVGKLYGQYGAWLIKKHPAAYLQYFVGQGIEWYLYPKVDITNIFPDGGVPILPETKNWFGTHDDWWACSTGKFYSITYFPAVVTILNLLFILGVIGFYFCGCHKTAGPLANKVVMLMACFWLIDLLFVICTTPALLRYALSGVIFNMVFVPVLLERIGLSGSTSKALFQPVIPEIKDLPSAQ